MNKRTYYYVIVFFGGNSLALLLLFLFLLCRQAKEATNCWGKERKERERERKGRRKDLFIDPKVELLSFRP